MIISTDPSKSGSSPLRANVIASLSGPPRIYLATLTCQFGEYLFSLRPAEPIFMFGIHKYDRYSPGTRVSAGTHITHRRTQKICLYLSNRLLLYHY